jgi:hypothetical protein
MRPRAKSCALRLALTADSSHQARSPDWNGFGRSNRSKTRGSPLQVFRTPCNKHSKNNQVWNNRSKSGLPTIPRTRVVEPSGRRCQSKCLWRFRRVSLGTRSTAKGFYAVYALLIAVAAAIVLTPNAPLGLLTVAVQTLAGVLLPSATVFLLLLCNDRAVLGPWVNDRWLNYFTGAIIAALVVLSMILTITVLFPDSSNAQTILGILTGGGVAAVVVALGMMALSQSGKGAAADAQASSARAVDRNAWRMPPLACREVERNRRRHSRLLAVEYQLTRAKGRPLVARSSHTGKDQEQQQAVDLTGSRSRRK